MSNAAALQALEYEAETTFGEDVTTFATHRIPIVGPVDTSGLKHDKVASARIVQRLQEGTPDILGAQGGTIKIKIWETGHGSTTVGSPTVDATETLLAYVFGNPTSNGLLAATASTTFGVGSTISSGVTTASGTFTAGSLCAAGIKGDGRADGQAYAIATHITTTLTPLTNFAGAPNNGDVLRPLVMFNLPEDATGSACNVTGLRMRFRSANLAYELHGVYPTDVQFDGGNTGDLPSWTITLAVSWWRYTATSGVSAVASNQYNPAPTAAGSFFLNDVGTTTRVPRTIRDFSLSIKLGVVMLPGPGGANIYQKCIGAKRVPSMITLKWKEDADAATATPVLDGYFTGTTSKHALYTLNPTPGTMAAFYWPNLRIVGARPVQITSDNINRLEITARADTGTTTTSDLTLSAMRIGRG